MIAFSLKLLPMSLLFLFSEVGTFKVKPITALRGVRTVQVDSVEDLLAILFITETNPRIVKQNKLKEEQKVLRKKVSLSMARPSLLIS